ncbi:flagellar motor switch phosphatase FliY [Caminicella sporogenes]|uniref:flagellar motor switch phosphatase FliY n=1 Tax=Caminicella sporogenes TaxID=166485 RepID=UPI002540E26F|nr:flagellar motor switch phosphatase FliY [Caminicella sporogenes]WIF94647.1 flagellar motor switch phosphatase FliY [Caminicella sporogenes]
MADMLSQEEIDALLNGTTTDLNDENLSLTNEEKDVLGEIGNISMGTAATTLFTLLGQKVTITTPKVLETTLEELSENYTIPSIAVIIKYKEGIEGFNLLILKEKDVKVITDLMMGGDGTNISQELTDLHLSAIGEAMNQMIGSACTSLSEMFNTKIDILPPEAYPIDFSNKDFGNIELKNDDKLVRIAFNMTVGDVLDSEIMQIIPLEFAKKMVQPLLNPKMNTSSKHEDSIASNQSNANTGYRSEEYESADNITKRTNADNNVYNSETAVHHQSYKDKEIPKNPVNVKPLQFESFDETGENFNQHNDISLIKDVPLNVTVELGRTVKQISEILDFGPGTVIELDKLVGEPLDILVNGKIVAKGEVVVVDENYGVRITDIVKNQKRINKFW